MQSEQIDKLAAALAEAQKEITSPPRNREVEVFSKRTNSKYKFRYATLDAIIEHVRPALTKNGLWFVQTLANGDGKYRLVTTLTHASGQWVSGETPILAESADNQAFGSALTYMKRYALSALLGIAADEDDDANEADGNTVESSRDRSPPPKQTKTAQATQQAANGVDTWIAQAKAAIAQMPDKAVLTRWQKDNAKTLASMKERYPEKHTDFVAWLDDQFNSLPQPQMQKDAAE